MLYLKNNAIRYKGDIYKLFFKIEENNLFWTD